MRRLADAFVTGAAAEGREFDYSPQAARRLDALVGSFLENAPPPDVVHSMILAMGAYLGEVIVRSGKGRWAYDEDEHAAVVQLAPDWRFSAFPMNKVAKRIHVGDEHSLNAFLDACLLGGPRR